MQRNAPNSPKQSPQLALNDASRCCPEQAVALSHCALAAKNDLVLGLLRMGGSLTSQDRQVRAKVENGSHSKRSAALGSQNFTFSFGYVMELSPLPFMSKGERISRQSDGWAHSSL